MINPRELCLLHTNQRILIKELLQRKIDVTLINSTLELIEADYRGHKEFFLDRDSSIMPYNISIITGNKIVSKKIMMKNTISVNSGELFLLAQVREAINYAKKIGYPVVVKPNIGSHGDNVHMNLNNPVSIKSAIKKLANSGNKEFILEKQFEGKEFRIFITREGKFAVLHRDPAYVLGNGKDSISQLVKKENELRKIRVNALCPIIIERDYLKIKKLDLNYVPKKEEKIYLRSNSNIATGGICEDYTDKVHPSVIQIAKKALSVFHGMPYAGIDFMTKDIESRQSSESYRILEINSIPGVHMHLEPGKGKPIDISKYIVDIVFPETKR